ncbi:MAG: FAD-binding oxidoreductase [Chloroflexi bacterium]|nr:FAD-binding oxidoreductase [Chloroflexota bacterium]
MSYDAIVIGGGISGCATAYYLSSAGHSVALIEKDSLAAHASGFAFGSLHTRFQPPPGSPPVEWFRAESIELHHELAEILPEQSGVGYHFVEKAGLVLAFDEAEAAQLKPSGIAGFLRDDWSEDRLDVRWLAYGEFSHIEARVSTDVIGALYLGGTREISPGGFANALWAAAESNGATLINAEVSEINLANGAVSGVTTTDGTISTDIVVLAAGAWSRTLLNQGSSTSHIDLPVFPLKGEILRYDLGDEPPLPVSLWWGSDYASSKPDGLLHVGTTHTDSGFDENPSDSGRGAIARSAEHALPFLAGKKVSQHTACLRPTSLDGLPIVGEMPDARGLIAATGGGPIGIELGPAIGKLAASIAVGQSGNSSRYREFSPARFA